MNITKLLSSSAPPAVGAFALGVAVNAIALPAYAFAAAAFLALIVAHDYASRRLDRTAAAVTVTSAERLPCAA